MPTYRGNRGNLLQHWTLTELMLSARPSALGARLCFVDAYAMSPFATLSPKACADSTAPDFDRVRNRLDDQSLYEATWRALTRSLPCEYPSSAAFVRSLWAGPLHLLLCEANSDTAEQIESWLRTLDSGRTSFELHSGDWRERFLRGIEVTADAYVLSFDPNMFDRHGPPKSPIPANMYPPDLATIRVALTGLPSSAPVFLQLSTYSANNGNSQQQVIEAVAPQFATDGFSLAATVRVDKQMMSLVFTRNASVPSDLVPRFECWLKKALA